MSEKVEYHGGFMSPEKADELRAELTALRARNEELREALDGCVEHMEHSTPQGRAAYEAARTALKRGEK